MELYLQQAWGMKSMILELSNHLEHANLIMSPRDTSKEQFINWSEDFNNANVKLLFDPQLYYPKSEHSRLIKHDYWDSNYITKISNNKTETEALIESILEYNEIIGSEKFIIPSAMFEYSETWIKLFEKNSEELIKATRKIVTNKEIYLTIPLPSNFLNYPNKSVIDKFLIILAEFDIDGYYLIAEPIDNSYPCKNPLWLSNLFNMCAGLKSQGRKVIVGYANQQYLGLAVTGVDAIASGNHLNSRKFSNKFEDTQGIKIGALPTYYYHPKALSEYPLEMLDYAMSVNELESFNLENKYNAFTENLFDEILPTDSKFNESASFKHYLYMLSIQASTMRKDSYEETYENCVNLLNSAENEIKRLEQVGIFAERRGMHDCISTCRTALISVNKNWGDQLSLEWDDL